MYNLNVVDKLSADPLPVYGVSSKSLESYVTTAKDVIRNINRMPNAEFLIDGQDNGRLRQGKNIEKDGD